MTGRRLYDRFCDASREHDDTVWSATQEKWVKPTKVAWPYLTWHQQRVWNDLARRITPKPTAPKTALLVSIGEKKIQGIKEFRAATGCSLLEAKTTADAVAAGNHVKVKIPKGMSGGSLRTALAEWRVVVA